MAVNHAHEALSPLLVVDNGTHFLRELEEALTSLAIPYDLAVTHDAASVEYSVTAEELRAYAGAILTGGDAHVYEREQLASIAVGANLSSLTERPLLGICLGHQLIASRYGSTVAPLPGAIDRLDVIEVIHDDPLFDGLERRFTARLAHDDLVTNLGTPLLALARSETGRFEAFRHHAHPVYGLQFHPEASGEPGRRILENFAHLCASRLRADNVRRGTLDSRPAFPAAAR